MEIKQLRYFRTVAEAGSLTQAAALLRVTPGTLSKAMQQFETELGKDLLTRAGRRLVPTEAGRRLYRESHRLNDEYLRLLRSLDDSKAIGPRAVRLASFEVFTTHAMGRMVADHLRQWNVQVADLSPGDIEQAVLRREVDAGITYAPTPSDDLKHHRVARVEFATFVRKRSFSGVPTKQLPYAVPTAVVRHGSEDVLGIDCWPYASVPRRIKYRLTTLETGLELTRRGLCAVFIPLFVAGLQNETVRPELRLERRNNPKGMSRVIRDVHLVTRHDAESVPDTSGLAGALRATIGHGERALRRARVR